MAELSTPVRKAGEYSVHKDRESRSAWRIFRLSITAGIGARHKERITLMIPIACLGERRETLLPPSLSLCLTLPLCRFMLAAWVSAAFVRKDGQEKVPVSLAETAASLTYLFFHWIEQKRSRRRRARRGEKQQATAKRCDPAALPIILQFINVASLLARENNKNYRTIAPGSPSA